MIDCEDGRVYEVMRRLGDVGSEDCEHWAKGAPRTASFPRRSSGANEDRRARPRAVSNTSI